jgi:hypothetical protein
MKNSGNIKNDTASTELEFLEITLYTCVLEVLVWNFNRDTSYPD